MKGIIATVCIFISTVSLFAQSPRVPDRMEFAGISLRIMEPARREIQESVDALTKNPRYYEIYIQRARTYFPIIERVFKEENVPDDFKYLALQESALVSDAVSSAKAVGFWQMKDFTALELGLRVDRNVDERMNIVSSSRGAARYMKKNNERYFDNWLITLMAYQMGPGAALKAGGEKFKGDRKMTIDRSTYWYIKKYLAHKVAFENVLKGATDISVVEYTDGSGKTLKQISDEAGVQEDELGKYNKWLRRGKIPDDQLYTVVLPLTSATRLSIPVETHQAPEKRRMERVSTTSLSRDYELASPDAFPEFNDRRLAENGKISRINGIKGVKARENDRVASLASKGDITVERFLRYNDMTRKDHVIPGVVYYVKHKRGKPRAYYHAVQKGENLWDVSQQYGMKLKKLKKRNRITGAGPITLKEGRILWLRYIRPADVPVEYNQPQIPKRTKETPVFTKNDASRATDDETSIEFADNTESTIQLDHSEPDNIITGKAVSSSPTTPEEKEIKEEPIKEKVSAENTGDQELKTQTENAPDSVRTIHTVKPGETYYAISRKYDVDIHKLLAWNNVNINDPLAINQQMIIYQAAKIEKISEPQKAEGSGSQYYTVKSGDTLYSIARQFGLSLNELKSMNNKQDDNLDPGDRILIK